MTKLTAAPPDNSSRPPPEPAAPDVRRNLILQVLIDSGGSFGGNLIQVVTVLTVFLRALGASNTVIGIAPSLQAAAMALVPLAAAHWTRRLRRLRLLYTLLHVVATAFWIPVGLLTLRWAQTQPVAMMVVLFAALLLIGGFYGATVPLWGRLLPRLFGGGQRGMAVGLANTAASVTCVWANLYLRRVLISRPFPQRFAHLFFAAALTIGLSRLLGLLYHEEVPAASDAPEAEPPERLLAALGRLWRENHRLRRLLLARLPYEAGQAATGFLVVYALGKFAGVGEGFGGLFGMVAGAASIVFSLGLGRLGDRHGFRRVLGLGMLGTASSALLMLLSRHPYVALASAAGAALGVVADGIIGWPNLLVEMTADHDRGHAIGLAALLMFPLRLVGPIAWGVLGDAVSLDWVLGLAAGLMVLGWAVTMAMVDDPRRPGQRLLRWRRGEY